MSLPWGAEGHLLAGRYRLMAQAGTGGMAVVWRANDLVLDREVAVKLLTAEGAAETDVVQRLKAEAQAIARLKHPHITSVHDFGQHTSPDGSVHPFVVMELVEGTTLSRRLADGTPMPWVQAARVAAQVASALAYAHSRRIAHRDISCTNIMLTDEGAKVLDFGIAAILGQPDSTSDQDFIGTPAYVAPERLRDPTAVTSAIDVYALGLVWYHMLTGEMPWQARSGTGLIQAHLVYAPAPLPPIDGMPASLTDLCMSCLAKNPEDRPTSAQLAETLAEFAHAPRPPAEPTIGMALPGPRRPQRTKALIITVGLVGGLAVAGAAAPLWLRPTLNDGQSPAGAPVTEQTAPSYAAGTPSVPATASPSRAVAGPGENAPVTPTAPVVVQPPATPPATGPAATPTPPQGQDITAQGGTVRVSCDGATARVLDTFPAPGYTIKDYDPGPANEVQVVFTSENHESEIKVRCPEGTPRPRVKETPL